ncbi:tetratricopeptide repeat-containing sensor histidine kinase [Leeuwenhoekiella sp. UBA6783]|uniref:tetratricopeptide repeat-containing sensor histidine kinase n=1 Tax=Leeuwenhoekiella sp. UBA6783 TaxID=1946747 RepID=UPI0025B8702A|nr:hypothetical protein [Leeuwenhoekiella sp. UBA6783]
MDSISYYDLKVQKKEYSLQQRKECATKAFIKVRHKTADSRFGRLLYQKNYLHLLSGEYDSLLHYDKLINNNNLLDDPHILAMHQYLMGYYFETIVQQPDSAFNHYTKSQFYYQQTSDSSGIAKALLNMGGIQNEQNDYFGSKETLTEALTYIKDETDADTYLSVLDRLAQNHRKLQNFEEAQALYKIILSKSQGVDMITYKNNLATIYIDLGEYSKGLKILRQLSSDSLVNESDQKARVLDNLAYARWLSGVDVNNEAFLVPLRMRRMANDQLGAIASYTHLGEFYMGRQPNRAMVYFDSVIDISRNLNNPRAEQKALKFKMQLVPQNITYRNRYITLQDSLYASELKVKTQFAKYKYDDKLKQESILRLEKEKATKELEASRERTAKWAFFIGVLGLLILLVLGYYLYKQRVRRLKTQNRADRVEASYKTEAVLSQRLHDDFGAGLHHVMLLVQSKSEPEKILNELDKLYQQSRDFSREINAVDTGVNYKEALYTMLDQIKPENTRLLISGSKEIAWQVLSNVTKITLYKVLRELFINMAKHSQATIVTLNFKKNSEGIEIRYSDNGVGVSQSKKIIKNGLLNTEKRIEAIGGTITFDSKQGDGFKALIKMPI